MTGSAAGLGCVGAPRCVGAGFGSAMSVPMAKQVGAGMEAEVGVGLGVGAGVGTVLGLRGVTLHAGGTEGSTPTPSRCIN
mmetsp:Transcript_2313/g.3885  ORF Transcript_2313/g.3885 Transcript_2313/m.3885 type:complete len:80 (+) Transcript_2313:536-775(+)